MWYVIQVCTGTEEAVRVQCERKLSSHVMERCFIPYCEQMRRYQKQWHKEKKILFPGYVFVVSDRLDQLFFELKNVSGLTKLIGTGQDIVPLSQQEVDLIRRLGGDEDVVTISEGVIEGGKVIITDGPLMGMEGCIRRIDRHKRLAYLEIEMMGRLVETQVGLEIVSKAEEKSWEVDCESS